MATVSYLTVDGEILSETRDGVDRDYLPDPLGSTIHLLDNSQTKTDTWSYDAWGTATRLTGSTATPFKFVGTLGYYSDSSSQVYVRARYYRPIQGRWMTVDPMWPMEHAFRYAGSSPLTNVDPSGRQFSNLVECWWCAGAIADNWIPTLAHKCNACYAHCMTCCTLARSVDTECAREAQRRQNAGSKIDQKYKDARTRYCELGIRKSILPWGPGLNGQADCSKKCLQSCPYKKPNPRKECDKHLRIIGGKVVPDFPPEFPYLKKCTCPSKSE